MAYSNQTINITDPVPTVLTVPFLYLLDQHVFIDINAVPFELKHTDWNTAQTISTARMGLQADDVVRIYRVTPKDEVLVNYSAGADTSDTNLDSANAQLLYIVQEQLDSLTDAIRLGSDLKWDAQGYVVRNGADPVDPADLVTKQYADTVNDAVATDAEAADISATEAAASAAAALVSEQNSALSEGEAADSADDAYDAALAAQAARDAIPAAGDILVVPDIGSTVQGYDADILKADTTDLLQTVYGDEAQVVTTDELGGATTITRNHILWTPTGPTAGLTNLVPWPYDGTFIIHLYPTNVDTLNVSTDLKLPSVYTEPDMSAGEVRIVVEVFNGRKSLVSIQNMEA